MSSLDATQSSEQALVSVIRAATAALNAVGTVTLTAEIAAFDAARKAAAARISSAGEHVVAGFVSLTLDNLDVANALTRALFERETPPAKPTTTKGVLHGFCTCQGGCPMCCPEDYPAEASPLCDAALAAHHQSVAETVAWATGRFDEFPEEFGPAAVEPGRVTAAAVAVAKQVEEDAAADEAVIETCMNVAQEAAAMPENVCRIEEANFTTPATSNDPASEAPKAIARQEVMKQADAKSGAGKNGAAKHRKRK